MRSLPAIIILFISLSCKEKPSRWTTTEKPDEFDPIELTLDEFSLNNHPIILTKDDLLKYYGLPDTITTGLFFRIMSNTERNDSLVHYQIYKYGKNRFAVWNENAQIQFIDFQNSDDILKNKTLQLSGTTSLQEVKSQYPYAYDWRNYPLHRQFGTDPQYLFGFKKENCVWLDFKNGLDDFHWNIQLTFLNDILIWADFDIVEDKYRP